MKKFNEIKKINGVINLRRNPTWGYTARVEYIEIDDEILDFSNDRSMTASGCNYDKIEKAIHIALSKECEELPDYIPNHRNFGEKHFFGEHGFELSDGKIEIFPSLFPAFKKISR